MNTRIIFIFYNGFINFYYIELIMYFYLYSQGVPLSRNSSVASKQWRIGKKIINCLGT